MQPVNTLNALGSQVQFFTGKTLADSLKAALEWGAAHKVTVQHYYAQKFDGRSIIADYTDGSLYL